MPKRYLVIQNKGDEQRQSSAINTRSASKRANAEEPISAKRTKKETNKENVPKNPTIESESPVIESPILPVDTSKPSAYDADDDQTEGDDESSISSATIADNDDEVEEPISSLADDDNAGEDHPTNNLYLVYKNRKPHKEVYIISKTARYWSLRYRQVLRHVIPDLYGMYIHNDFSCYGELEVVENCLLDLTKTLFLIQRGITQTRRTMDKVNYPLGFRRLEALTILLDYTDGISGIDDGDRFYDIMRVIGACYVTILQGLLPKIMFDKIESFDEILVKKLKKISRQLPNFKQVLEQALIIGHTFLTIADVCSAYTKILQIVYCNWLFILENISIDLTDPCTLSNANLWEALKHAASINPNDVEHGDKESFHFLKELRAYKEQHGLGGDAHDLRKWTRSEREQYSFRRFNLLNNFWF